MTTPAYTCRRSEPPDIKRENTYIAPWQPESPNPSAADIGLYLRGRNQANGLSNHMNQDKCLHAKEPSHMGLYHNSGNAFLSTYFASFGLEEQGTSLHATYGDVNDNISDPILQDLQDIGDTTYMLSNSQECDEIDPVMVFTPGTPDWSSTGASIDQSNLDFCTIDFDSCPPLDTASELSLQCYDGNFRLSEWDPKFLGSQETHYGHDIRAFDGHCFNPPLSMPAEPMDASVSPKTSLNLVPEVPEVMSRLFAQIYPPDMQDQKAQGEKEAIINQEASEPTPRRRRGRPSKRERNKRMGLECEDSEPQPSRAGYEPGPELYRILETPLLQALINNKQAYADSLIPSRKPFTCRFNGCRHGRHFYTPAEMLAHYVSAGHKPSHFCNHQDCCYSVIGFDIPCHLRRHLDSVHNLQVKEPNPPRGRGRPPKISKLSDRRRAAKRNQKVDVCSV